MFNITQEEKSYNPAQGGQKLSFNTFKIHSLKKNKEEKEKIKLL